MNIQIFQQEKKDGLEDAIKSRSSFSMASLIKEASEGDRPRIFHPALASAVNHGANPDQVDLFYMESVLASIGWNDNDDVFDPFEAFSARYTPVDKPLNVDHDDNIIVGHLTASRLVGTDGKEISNDLVYSDIPKEFDIVVGGVIYTHWRDEEKKKLMEQVFAEIKSGERYVSMECLFPHFDYAVASEDGKSQYVVERSEKTSSLTKYLRAYGGTGVYQNYRIGRLLRGFVFSGKGLVKVPANKKSLILSYAKFQTQEKVALAFIQGSKMENENLVKELKEQLATAQANERKLLQENADKVNELKTVNDAKAALDVQLNGLKEVIAAKDKKLTEVEGALATANTELTSVKQKLGLMEAEARKADRLAKMADLDLSDEKKVALAAQFAPAELDGAFAELISVFPKKTKQAPIVLDVEAAQASVAGKPTLVTPPVDEAGNRLSALKTWASANLIGENK